MEPTGWEPVSAKVKLRAALHAWRAEYESLSAHNLEELIGIVKELFMDDIIQAEDIEFLKNFRAYAKFKPDSFSGSCNTAEEEETKQAIKEVAIRYQMDALMLNNPSIDRLLAHVVDLEAELIAMERTNDFIIPMPLTGQPNANGDVFPEGFKIKKGDKVRHVDKEGTVIGHVEEVGEDSLMIQLGITKEAVALRNRIAAGKVLSASSVFRDSSKFTVSLSKTTPHRNGNGVVGISVGDGPGDQVVFSKVTDHGNHLKVLRHARLVTKAVMLSLENTDTNNGDKDVTT